MENLVVEFMADGRQYFADVELNGTADSWRAHAKISGPSPIKELNITYRLGDFLSPMFLSKANLYFFSPLLDAVAEKAAILLPSQSIQA